MDHSHQEPELSLTNGDAGPPVDLGRLLRTLALPTFGLAFAISVLTTYGPVLLREFTGSETAIGFAIGGEGVFALFLPLIVGGLTDRTETRFGARLPYVLAAAPPLAIAIALLPFSGSYGAAVALIFLFFVAYFVYYPPYRALFADLVPESHYGRAQGDQGVMRGLGLGAALLAGGLLLSVWTPLPFVLAAVAVLATSAVLVREIRGRATGDVACCLPYGTKGTAQSVRRLLRERPELRAYVAANALWEFSLVGLKAFIVLYVIEGLGHSVTVATGVIGVVAGAYVVAALGVGRVADRIGLYRLLRIALWVYGIGLVVGGFPTTITPMLIGLPIVALGGAVLMTLPYGLLMSMMPEGSEGAVSGLYGFSRGLGGILGPIGVGAAIELGRPLFASTNGFAAMWPAIGIPILLSLTLLPVMERNIRSNQARPVRIPVDSGPISEHLAEPEQTSAR